MKNNIAFICQYKGKIKEVKLIELLIQFNLFIIFKSEVYREFDIDILTEILVKMHNCPEQKQNRMFVNRTHCTLG